MATQSESRELKEVIRRALIMVLGALEDDMGVPRSIPTKEERRSLRMLRGE
jgi:hypothetical protein